MHVGFGSFFQNIGSPRSDAEVWRHELGLADRAEAYGYDSLWTVEHHFADYTMSPNPLQYLSWVAGRTQGVKLGTMVTVLPWHDPLRVAEEAAVVDHLSGGRLVLGIGRGLARMEFDGFKVDMADSRTLFKEYADAILTSFDTGTFEYDGELLKQPAVEIRPAPLASLRGRTYASSISPESQELMARLGVGIMIFIQKPWEQTIADVERYSAVFREVNGHEPPKPILVMFAAVDPDRGKAEQLFQHGVEYYASSTDHYEFHDAELAKITGYEYYGNIAARIAKTGRGAFEKFLADLQPWGTPDEVAEHILEAVRRVDAAGVVAVSSFGTMSDEDAIENQRVFATEVLPKLKPLDTGPDIGIAVARAGA